MTSGGYGFQCNRIDVLLRFMQIDIGLLTALDALLTEGSVTGAAARMNRSVSAMSRTLTRIRRVVGDPILVRAGARLVPTPRAEQLRSRVRGLVEDANSILSPDRIDLASFQRTFVIRANDAFISAFALELVASVRCEAPRVTLCFAAEGDEEVSALREGRVDLDIGVQGGAGPEVKAQLLFREHFVGVARANHHLVKGKITPTRYAACSHVVASRRGLVQGPIDNMLASLGLSRHVALVVPSHTSALDVVAKSDLVGAVPASLAGRLAGARQTLKVFNLPFETRVMAIGQAWHPRLDNDAAHRWLRTKIREVCRGRRSPPPAQQPNRDRIRKTRPDAGNG
jgi:DNA-binding transcriptional LysR family regulator